MLHAKVLRGKYWRLSKAKLGLNESNMIDIEIFSSAATFDIIDIKTSLRQAIIPHSANLNGNINFFKTNKCFLGDEISGYKWMSANKNIIVQCLSQHGGYITKIPGELITWEMCTAALNNAAWIFPFIPQHMHTETICTYSIQNFPQNIAHVSSKVLTKQMCLDAVEIDGFVLSLIPWHMRTFDVCMSAVHNNPKAINYVPLKYKSKLKELMIHNNINF